ncbi:MAG TPA: VCBS repeat-containing protein [Steroidobacteraceae bacterium]|nr:VCBS repeat-containing protein [Steroidobacteraceae bacterium]
MLHQLPRVNSLRMALLIACAVLASCDDHDHRGCYGCGNVTPTEFSNGVVSADFNGDGFADVVALSTVQPAVSANPSNIKAYLSTAAGAFAAPVATPDGFNPLYLAGADLNGDGLMDVVTASFDDGALGVFFNNKASPGIFNPALVLNSPGASQVAIADMNGDGLPDLVSADFNVSLFVQTSPGTFAAPVGLYAGGANWVALGDLNGDGAADVALADSVGVKVLMHTGAASSTTFAAPVSVFTQSSNANVAGGNIIAIGDVDGDGLNDLVITDPGPTGGMATAVYILIQNPATQGTFLTPVGYPIATQDRPQSILLRDLQGTGKLDIVIGGQKFVTVLLHDPANPGKFLAANIYPAAGANEIAIADINGDGKPDIVVSNGVTFPMQGGVATTHPGVLLQSATTPGTFGALQDLP